MKGSRPDDLRRRNRAAVIAALRRLRQPSRTEIAAVTGLSHATISAIAADLIAEGAVIETRQPMAAGVRRGRPQVGLELRPGAAAVVAACLSLNRLSVALVDYRGEVVAEEAQRLRTQSMDAAAVTDAVVGGVARLLDRHAAGPMAVQRIALAVQGVTDRVGRTMVWSPITPAQEVGFAAALETALGIDATVENDCNMMAEALRWRDPARYGENFIVVLLSDGIGMGLVHQGRRFSGTRSSGGEFGHMTHRPDGALCRCGRRGCIEAYAGNYAIWRAAGGLAEDAAPAEDLTHDEMQALAARARAGSAPERLAFARAGEAIGFGLGSIFALFDPAPVALVGAGAEAFDLVEAPLRDALARTAGGEHGGDVQFETIADELSLMRHGSAMRALLDVDEAVVAAGRLAGAGEPLPRATRRYASRIA